jgi:hypothetical protein
MQVGRRSKQITGKNFTVPKYFETYKPLYTTTSEGHFLKIILVKIHELQHVSAKMNL